MIKTTGMILDDLSSYSNPKTKLSRMVKDGIYFPIIRGLYETDRNTPRYLLAGSIYGPSYISFEFALSYYGLIPEAVYAVTSATFEKKKKKKYSTIFGTFLYRDVPSSAFPYEIKLIREGEYYYRIAGPEKALCDKLYTLSPVSNIEALSQMLFEDLRIDEDEFRKLSYEKVLFLYKKYSSTNVNKLEKLMRRLNKWFLLFLKCLITMK